MKLPVVSLEVAEAEITAWLDKREVFDSVREENKDNIKLLIEAMSKGYLTLNDKGEFTQKLIHPNTESEQPVKELKYRNRLNDNMLKGPLQGVKAGDVDGRMLAYQVAMTGEGKGVITALDSMDKKIMMAIVFFFT